MAEFNNPKNYKREFEFQPPLKTFTGNYISAEPEIKVIPLKKGHKWVVLGSDGLWDELGRQEVAEECKKTKIEELGPRLIHKCL